MWKNQNLLPVSERGSFRRMAMGFFLMFTGALALYYGNVFIENVALRLENSGLPSILLVVTSSLLIHGVQILLLFLAWIAVSDGIARYFDRYELSIKLLVPPAGIWITYVTLPLFSPLLKYSFPLNFYAGVLLIVLFQTLTLQVDNWLDKSAAMLLWVYSIQSLELIPTPLADGSVEYTFFRAAFHTSGEMAIASMTGMSLFMSFMAGAVFSTWLLASYSIKLVQVRRSWVKELGGTTKTETDGLSQVSMLDMRNLVHDLKNPLAAIKGMAIMLRGGADNSVSEKADIMLNATNYMERMIGEILHEDQLNKVKAGMFFDQLERHVRPFPWGDEVHISIDKEAEQETVAVNEIRFTRALLNVMDNAGRANRTAGTAGIELRITRKGEFLEIEILDNGPGIKANPAHKTQAHPKSGWGSTGLGLAFARKVAAAHGGNLFLSQRRDAPHGASVLISLPIRDA